MDIEFHYFMIYLSAARAGYASEEATIVAHATQSVDDNHIPVRELVTSSSYVASMRMPSNTTH